MKSFNSLVYDIPETVKEKELFICAQLAQMKTLSEIVILCREKFPHQKCKMTTQAISYYKRTKAPIIEQMREKILNATMNMNIPIADEKVRLRRTEQLYQLSATLVKKEDIINNSLKCLKEAREETKGEIGSTQNYLQFNQYNELSDEQLIEKKRELEGKIIDLSKVKKEEVYAQK